MIKYPDEKTVDELKKTRKRIIRYAYAIFIMGTVLQLGAWVIYFSTFIIGLPVMLFIIGIYLCILSMLSLQDAMQTSLFIYLKEHEKP
jgi:hypothetical protein